MRTKLLILFLSIMMGNSSCLYAQGPDWVRDNTWFFDNFSDTGVSWNKFREAYIGVAPSPSLDFDVVFYDLVFKDRLYNSGNCYGMCTMALLLMKNGGHLGFCHPPYIYDGIIKSNPGDTIGPTDPNLKTAIELTHAIQLGHGFITFVIDVIALGKIRDGGYAFQQMDYFMSQGDPPVICIGKEFPDFSDGHVLIPYAYEQTGSITKIYVYDPNRSYYGTGVNGKDFYVNQKNYITIDGDNWSFKMKSGTWSGSPSGGGTILTVPLSIAGRKDRLPQSLVADGLIALETILVYGENVRITQIREERTGRQLLNKYGTDAEISERKRLKDLLPFTFYGGMSLPDDYPKKLIYFYRGKNPLTLEIRAHGPYTVAMMFNGKYKEFKAFGRGNVQRFSTPDLSALKPTVR